MSQDMNIPKEQKVNFSSFVRMYLIMMVGSCFRPPSFTKRLITSSSYICSVLKWHVTLETQGGPVGIETVPVVQPQDLKTGQALVRIMCKRSSGTCPDSQ